MTHLKTITKINHTRTHNPANKFIQTFTQMPEMKIHENSSEEKSTVTPNSLNKCVYYSVHCDDVNENNR